MNAPDLAAFPASGTPYYYRKGWLPSDPMTVLVLENLGPRAPPTSPKGIFPAGLLRRQLTPGAREHVQHLMLSPSGQEGVFPAGYSDTGRKVPLRAQDTLYSTEIGADVPLVPRAELYNAGTFGPVNRYGLGLP